METTLEQTIKIKSFLHALPISDEHDSIVLETSSQRLWIQTNEAGDIIIKTVDGGTFDIKVGFNQITFK